MKKSLLAICIALALIVVLSSPVSANWAMFGSDLEHSGVAVGDWVPNPLVTWNFTTGGKVRSSPAVADGVVFVGSDDCNVYALNGTSGVKLWNFSTGGGIYSSPAVADGVLYIGSGDAKFYALNASSGAQIWSVAVVNGYFSSSAAVVDGVVYVGGGDGALYAFDAASGVKLWSFATHSTVWSCPAVSDGVVYFGSTEMDQAYVYALDAYSGVEIWNFSTGYRSMVFSSPAVVSGVVYVGADDRNVYALNAHTGVKIWNYTTGSLVESSPSVVGGVAYIGCNDHSLYALDAFSGSKLWSFEAKHVVLSSPAVLDGVVYVGSWDNNLYALDANNGSKLWSYTTAGSIFSSPAAVKGGQIYVGSDDGHVYAINSKSVSPYYVLNIPYSPTSGGGVKQYITINANGSVTPEGVPIVQNGNRYTLTGDLGGALKVLKDNIVVDGAGFRIFGDGTGMGGGNVVLNGRDHVTLMNTVVSGFFGTGINLGSFSVENPNSMIGSSNCIVTNNTVIGGAPMNCFSIWLEGQNNSITNNHVVGNNGIGILVERGSQHLIANNVIENNVLYGIGFEAGQATVKGNHLNNNTGGAFYFTDSNMGQLTPIQDIDSSNLVDGKPAYYWFNQHGRSVPSDAGYVLLINCSEITVSGLSISNGGYWNSYGIALVDTTNSLVTGNVLTAGTGIRILNFHTTGSCNVSVVGNTLSSGLMVGGGNTTIVGNTFTNKGISLGSGAYVGCNNFTRCDIAIKLQGSNNLIVNNSFLNNQVGIHIFMGSNNQICQNNFVNNTKHVEEQHSDPTQWPMDAYYSSSNNTFDQAGRGNYWSDYTGGDINGDGIGDTPYSIFENYTDYYPLMKLASTVYIASRGVAAIKAGSSSSPFDIASPSPISNQPFSTKSATTGAGNRLLIAASDLIVAAVALAGFSVLILLFIKRRRISKFCKSKKMMSDHQLYCRER